MAVLVTGGAGYIGSHTLLRLIEKGEEVIIVDNLSKGHIEAVQGGKLCIGDLLDTAFLEKVFSENNIDSVIHFAAFSLVGESVQIPLAYYKNNVAATINLLNTMKAFDVKNIVFSSTAAVYGNAEKMPIEEADRTEPSNPYGECKLAVEKMLQWAARSGDLRYISLRYFNAAGAHESGLLGEDHSPETHLIPLLLKTALGQMESLNIYGNDYPTFDGTCVRDYIHVVDLADAHLLALERLRKFGSSDVYNLGTGTGFSVKEVIDAAVNVTGREIRTAIAPRRPGDPPVLVASPEKAIKELGWKPKYNNIEKILQDAWNWHKNHINGYKI